MNNQNMMINKDQNGLIDHNAAFMQQFDSPTADDIDAEYAGSNIYQSGMNGMMSREAFEISQQENQEKELQLKEAPVEEEAAERQFQTKEDVYTEKQIQEEQKKQEKKNASDVKNIINKAQAEVKAKMMGASGNANTQTDKKTNTGTVKPDQKNKETSVAKKSIVVKTNATLDELTTMYMKLFKTHFGIDLNASMCFENTRKLCEFNAKDIDKTLYFIENTYRVSTLLYLASNLPIMIATSILAEKNRTNILKYVTTEVENAAKSYEDVKKLRIERYSKKFSEMKLNDAMTVTPGVTTINKELIDLMAVQFNEMCGKLKQFDNELSVTIGKFDESTLNDVIYTYSNWWYLLQGFENVKEMRTYVMAITDDTRRNLKL